MKQLIVSLVALNFLLCNVAAAEQERPNIIMVMADDLGWSDIGCYGGEIRTPHIDSLAHEGLRFTQFYNNAVCGPTRASLLTGLYCQQTGHAGEHWNQPKDYSKCVLSSEVLRHAGYQTMMVGKWQGSDLPLDRGFDHFFGPMCQGKISYFHDVQKNPFYLDRDRFPLPKDFYLTDAINDYSVRFLKDAISHDNPFFLYVAHIAPHWPLHAKETEIAPYRKRYRDQGWDESRAKRFESQRANQLVPAHWKLAPRPAAMGAWEDQRHQDWQAERMAVYAAQVAAIDEGLGQLLSVLKDSGKEQNTVVVFLSDNGAAPDGGIGPTQAGFGFGPKQANDRWRTDQVSIRPGSGPKNLPGPHDTFAAYGEAWATLSNTPFRSTKLSGYEGGIRTPLIVKWPEGVRKNQTSNQVGHVMDLMATWLDLAEVEYPAEFQGRSPLAMEGKSLLPIFAGKQRQGHDVLCWSVPRHHVVRMGKWKAIRPRNGGEWQLYDLEADGTETTNLAPQEPQRVDQLARHFASWQARVHAAPSH
ncbi:Arylsulfatase [Novipirellula galeiformis]|uniref:Arylsulfatase n=1 Tax=Novipirellula galeiformis TaxID=2528004 RepID=A0A5C6CE39_9BACT|nr:arylsulfatase [Novipirellula galeiformis]TWU21691.1 Arylsulfatase [Novipirellula galeiformis]